MNFIINLAALMAGGIVLGILLILANCMIVKFAGFIKDHRMKTYRIVYIPSRTIEYDRNGSKKIIFDSANSKYEYVKGRSREKAISNLYKKELTYNFLITFIEQVD